MRKNLLGLMLVFAFAGIWPTVAFSQLHIGSDRQLFLDHYILDELEDVNLRMHHPVNEGPVLYFDKVWEGNFSAYCTILKDGSLYKAYYRGVREAGSDGRDAETTCMAISTDGIHWTKPNLGIYDVDGNRNNNVILANDPPFSHNFSPFIDQNPDCLPNQKYKAIGGTGKSGLFAFTSPDGIHWTKMQEEAVFTQGLFDSQNVAFWSQSEERYVCYFRTWSEDGYNGYRSVSRTTSPDFIHWSDSVQMTFGDTPLEHLYTQQTSPYYRAPQIYIAIGARFMPDRQVLTDEQANALNVNPKYFKDCSDAIIMTSRGGNQYDRTFMESYIHPGIGLQNWVSRSNYPALNVVQTGENEMSVYVNENYAQPTAHLKRYSMRLDGFASAEAGYKGGSLTTKPFIFEGQELEINYSTSAAGSIQIEIQDESGHPIPGYSLDDCPEIIGNEIKRIVNWKGHPNVLPLQGKTIRLKFEMKDSNLYSFKFNK